MVRLDYAPLQKLRLFANWVNSYSRTVGALPNPDSKTGQLNSSAPEPTRPASGPTPASLLPALSTASVRITLSTQTPLLQSVTATSSTTRRPAALRQVCATSTRAAPLPQLPPRRAEPLFQPLSSKATASTTSPQTCRPPTTL